MKLVEAKKQASKFNTKQYWDHSRYSAKVVRILSEAIDPVKPNDNGWDVEVTIL